MRFVVIHRKGHSASALGPRNGAAALDLVSAAIHVTTGATTMNFESGVEFFDPGASATAPSTAAS